MGRRIFSRSLLLPVATPTTPSQPSLTPRLPYLLLYGVFVIDPPPLHQICLNTWPGWVEATVALVLQQNKVTGRNN